MNCALPEGFCNYNPCDPLCKKCKDNKVCEDVMLEVSERSEVVISGDILKDSAAISLELDKKMNYGYTLFDESISNGKRIYRLNKNVCWEIISS